MITLERAIALAAQAQEGQVDRCGEPYILHPLRVMLAVSPKARLAAVLHDVLEDTHLAADVLTNEGLGEPDLAAVVALTRIPFEPYAAFIDRCGADPIACEVKVADIRDNLSPIRVDRLLADERDSLGRRYRKALQQLEAEA